MRRKSTRIPYGNFGLTSAQYALGRHGFPGEIFNVLLRHVRGMAPYVLDIGCGTGISSRQLAEYGVRVAACDVDKNMIAQAHRHPSLRIKYETAAAEHLPFPDNHFDAVTTFSALHWFDANRALPEIKRVLKQEGIFLVVNKNDGDFKREYKKILQQYLGERLPDRKRDYDPSSLFSAYGFHTLEERAIPTIERFTREQLLSYFQSVGLWGLVPEEKRTQALDALVQAYLPKFRNGLVERQVKLFMLVGIKAE